MTTLQFRPPLFDGVVRERRAEILAAIVRSYADLMREIRNEGRAEIKKAGRFGAWALRVTGRKGQPIEVYGTSVVSAFEDGLVIQGKPLLWIPLTRAADAQKYSPRAFPGQLVKVERRNKAPLLVAAGGEPKYHGQTRVVMPKRINLFAMIERIVVRMGARFLSRLGNK